MPLRVRSGFLGAAGPTGGGLSTEAECGIIGGKTGPDTGKGVTDAVLSLYLAALESDGDKKQFRELYRRYHRVMERTALAVLHDPHDAEEAVQEAFLRVIENFSKIYEIPCKDLGGWLVIIVRNEAITILRRRRCHLPLEEGWADFAGQSRDLPDYSSMVQLFARLPDTYRAVLEMKLVLGWSTAEIARRLGLTESAVNTRLSRGRALLMLSLSAAMVLAVSPKARADIIRWTMQQDGRRVEFRYHGDGPAQALPQYRIAALPEGYTETERAASYAAGDVKYTNADGDMILLSYLYMSDGVVSGFELDNGDTMTDTQVNGIPATLIVSSMEGNFSSVTWRDTASNIEFTVAAVADEPVIIAMAESVSLCNSTN